MIRKKVNVIYFKPSGNVYRREQELVVGLCNVNDIIEHVKTYNIRYKELDYIILDGEDGVRPYIQPYLQRAERNVDGLKGFGR